MSQGRPSATPESTSKRPAAKNALYGAIGSVDRQCTVWRVPPLWTRCPIRTPFAITRWPVGTSMCTSTAALSRGWSLAANHQVAMWGSFMVTTSRRFASQLDSPSQLSRPGRPA